MSGMSDSLLPIWTVACQVPLSRGFSRQEYWSGVFFLLQGTFPDPGSNLPLMSFALAGEFFTTSASWRSEVKSLTRVRRFVTPWTVAYQAPLSLGFSRQEYLSGLPFPSPGELPNPGIKSGSPACRPPWATRELPAPPGKPIHQI